MTLVRNRMLSLTFAIAATMTCFIAVERTLNTTPHTIFASAQTGARPLDS